MTILEYDKLNKRLDLRNLVSQTTMSITVPVRNTESTPFISSNKMKVTICPNFGRTVPFFFCKIVPLLNSNTNCPGFYHFYF